MVLLIPQKKIGLQNEIYISEDDKHNLTYLYKMQERLERELERKEDWTNRHLLHSVKHEIELRNGTSN